MKTVLTIGEMHLATQIGSLRKIESMSKKLPNKHGFDGADSWSIDIEGAAGEIAVAKVLNVFWGGTINTFKTIGDVGRLEVRTTSKENNSLIVRNNDKDESIFVLVTGTSPEFNVVGWLTGKEAKQTQWSRDYNGRPPAYFVPQSALKDMNELQARV